MSQNLFLPYGVVDIVSHLASSGGGHMARAEALTNLRFSLWAVGHGLNQISQVEKSKFEEYPNPACIIPIGSIISQLARLSYQLPGPSSRTIWITVGLDRVSITLNLL